MFLAWNWLFLVVVCCFLGFFGVLGVGVEGFVAGVFALFCCFRVDVVCCWCACVFLRLPVWMRRGSLFVMIDRLSFGSTTRR